MHLFLTTIRFYLLVGKIKKFFDLDLFPCIGRQKKEKKIHRSKKLLSEEFDIEENVPEAIRRRKLGGKGDNTKLEDRTDNKEPNFNTAAYHKKQHEI